jgi:hypothetical protein
MTHTFNAPWSTGLMALAKLLQDCKNKAGKITNEPRYKEIMEKIDLYVANARLLHPEYFYTDRELEVMNKGIGPDGYQQSRNIIESWKR